MQKSEKNLAKLSKPICGGAHFQQAVVGYKFGEKNSHIVLSIILLSFDIISYDSLGTGSVYTTNAKKKKKKTDLSFERYISTNKIFCCNILLMSACILELTYALLKQHSEKQLRKMFFILLFYIIFANFILKSV